MVKHSELLKQDPDAVVSNGHGGVYVPINQLEDMLDDFHWETQNYHSIIYKDGYANLNVAASIELVLNFTTDEGEKIRRTFVGACNFSLLSLMPIQDWNATAKSMCIKNAASDAGKRFGRGINQENIPDRSVFTEKSRVANKKAPDSKIMQQFLKAVEAGDQPTITMLSNIYDIKTEKEGEDAA